MINILELRTFWALLLTCSRFTRVWRGGVFCDSISLFKCQFYLQFYFMNFQLRKIFIFCNGISNYSEFIVVHIWADSGIFYPPIFISMYSIRFFRKKKYYNLTWFYDFTIFILTPLLFGVFGFGKLIGVYEKRTIVRPGPGMGSLLSIIYKSFWSSIYLFDPSLVGHWGTSSLFIHATSDMWHDLFRVDLLIILITASFKCHKHQHLKRDTISWMDVKCLSLSPVPIDRVSP